MILSRNKEVERVFERGGVYFKVPFMIYFTENISHLTIVLQNMILTLKVCLVPS